MREKKAAASGSSPSLGGIGEVGGVWTLISLPRTSHLKPDRRLDLLVNLQGGQKVNSV